MDNKKTTLLAGLVFAIGFAFRVPVLLHPHLGMEDLYAVALRGESVKDLIRSADASGQAPFFNVFYGLWSRVSENSIWLVAPIFIISLLVVYQSYKIGSDFFGEKAGLWISYLVAISPFMIHFSGKIRYEYFMIASALGMFKYAFKTINGEGTFKDAALYVVFALIGIYNLYYAVFLIMGFNIWFLIKRNNVVAWILSQLAVLVFVAPWMSVMWRQFSDRTGVAVDIAMVARSLFSRSVLNIIDILVVFFSGIHIQLHADDVISKGIFLASVAVLGIVFWGIINIFTCKVKARREEILYVICVHAIGVFIMFIMNLWKGAPIFGKYTIGLAPIHFLVVGSVISVMSRRTNIIVFILISSLSVLSLVPYYSIIANPPGAESMMEYIEDVEKKGDVILVYPSFYEHELAYYYKGAIEINGVPRDHDMINNITGVNDYGENLFKRMESVSEAGRIWLIFPNEKDKGSVAGGMVVKELGKKGFSPMYEQEYRATTIPECKGLAIMYGRD